MIDLKKRLKTAEGFWADVPYQVCDEPSRRSPRNIENKESCWNGQEPGSYDVKIVEDGLAHRHLILLVVCRRRGWHAIASVPRSNLSAEPQ